ncbi:MAG: polysaccharide biosynthesis C-terminal domain-containing protein [Bacteroidota bacterium]
MSQLKTLASQTVIYGASSIIGRMLNYLLVPYYTKVFVTSEYGIVTEFYAYAVFFNVIYTYGLETAYFRFASQHKKSENDIYNSAVTIILVSSTILSGLLFLFSEPIATYLEYPGRAYFIKWLAAIFALDAIVAIPFAKLRIEGKAKLFATAKLVNIGLNIGLNLFLISFCRQVYLGELAPFFKPLITKFYLPDYSIEYVFISNLIANAAFILILRKQLTIIRLKISWAFLKPMLKYAYPILFTGLAYATNETLSRWALKYWLPENFYPGYSNLEILGIFGAAYKLSIFMVLGIQAFRYAAEPFFFTKSESKDSPKLFALVMHWFIIFGCFVLLCIGTNLDYLQYLLRHEDYRWGVSIVPILLLANLFFGIYYNLSVWYKLTDRTYFGSWMTAGGAIITVTLNYLLIPLYGFYGSAVVTLIVYFLMTFTSYMIGRKYYPIPYYVTRDSLYLLITMALIFIINEISIENQWLVLACRAIIISLFVFIVWQLEKTKLPAKTS